MRTWSPVWSRIGCLPEGPPPWGKILGARHVFQLPPAGECSRRALRISGGSSTGREILLTLVHNSLDVFQRLEELKCQFLGTNA